MWCCFCDMGIIKILIISIISFLVYKFFFRKINIKNSLPNKVVFISGASGGIGECLAHVFYIAGCRVVLAARREEELERVRKDLLETHSTTITHPPVILKLDLTDIDSLESKVQQVLDIHGRIDILVNNAGMGLRGKIVDTKFDAEMKVFMTNYFGTVALTRAVLPSMIKRKQGRILCISSVLGKFAVPFFNPYCASKFAMQAFCDSLRAEVDEHNVKVSIVSPGYVDTSFSKNTITTKGDIYGKEDEVLKAGESPMRMAEKILQSVLADKDEEMICYQYIRGAYWLRVLFPSLYFSIMAKRARDFKAEFEN